MVDAAENQEPTSRPLTTVKEEVTLDRLEQTDAPVSRTFVVVVVAV